MSVAIASETIPPKQSMGISVGKYVKSFFIFFFY